MTTRMTPTEPTLDHLMKLPTDLSTLIHYTREFAPVHDHFPYAETAELLGHLADMLEVLQLDVTRADRGVQ